MYKYLLALCLCLPAHAARLEPALVPQAASQRVLVERMARLFAWRWLQPATVDGQKQLQSAANQFDKQLQLLSAVTRDDADLAENYALLSQQWADFRPRVSARPDNSNARPMLEASEEMAWIAQKGGQMLEEKIGSAQKPVRLAEDIAALSQRLAKIYLLQSAGMKLPFLAKDLASARSEFDAGMKELKASKHNNVSVRAQLQLVDTQWLFFQQAIDELARNNTDPQLQQNVLTTSERIYEVSSELAQRYQQQGN
ncbi:hypothetical protein [Chitinimonas naiadis]